MSIRIHPEVADFHININALRFWHGSCFVLAARVSNLNLKEIDMKTNEQSSVFYRTLAAVAMITPILLVFAAGTLPEGLGQRGDLIVYGHEVLLAVIATALILRGVYTLGFSKALKIAASEPKHSVTA